MNFCGNCGAPAGGTAVCATCGHRLGAVAESSTDVAVANPFSGVPLLDYGRDAVALLLLLLSLAMPWDLSDTTVEKPYALAATVVSIASLSLPYLKRGRVIGDSLSLSQLKLVRAAAAVPYIVVVAVTLIRGYVVEDPAAGIGIGVGFGLAGALLAAQTRASELSDHVREASLWRGILIGITGAFAVLTLASLVMFLAGDVGQRLSGGDLIDEILISPLMITLVALPMVSFARSAGVWRDIGLLLGVVGLFIGFWQLGAQATVHTSWSLQNSPLGPLLLALPTLGVGLSSPALRSSPGATFSTRAGCVQWADAAQKLLLVAAGFPLAIYLARAVEHSVGRGATITVVVLYLIALIAVLVGRNLLPSERGRSRKPTVVATTFAAAVGVVVTIVLGASDAISVDIVDVVSLSVLWWFAAAVVIALTATRALKGAQTDPSNADRHAVAAGLGASREPERVTPETAANNAASSSEEPRVVDVMTKPDAPTDAPEKILVEETPAEETSEPSDTAATETDDSPDEQGLGDDETQVLQRVEPEPEPSASGYTESIASDPRTPLHVLADIAAREPSLRPHLAANPSTYPDLVDWLRQLGDPDVDAALRRRDRGEK